MLAFYLFFLLFFQKRYSILLSEAYSAIPSNSHIEVFQSFIPPYGKVSDFSLCTDIFSFAYKIAQASAKQISSFQPPSTSNSYLASPL